MRTVHCSSRRGVYPSMHWARGCLPAPWTEWPDACDNITLPQTSFAGSEDYVQNLSIPNVINGPKSINSWALDGYLLTIRPPAPVYEMSKNQTGLMEFQTEIFLDLFLPSIT